MLKESDYVKITVAVPRQSADKIRQALGAAGAGVQGNYKYCSGSYLAIGRFIPKTGSHPAIGQTGKLEEVDEEIITTICHKDLVENVIVAVKKVHPYEEPPIDIMPRYDIV
jgi:hypothetical protein